MHLYPILQPLVKAVIRPIWKPTVSGNEHIPAAGPVILACNHQAAAETYFVPCMIDREVHWLGKDGLFKGKGVAGKLFAFIMRSVNVIPVDRSGSGTANAALATGIRVLQGGNLLGVFPEGTRSPDGRMYRGKTGAVRLALATGAPIVPVAVLGAFEAQSKGSILPKLGSRMHTQIGPAINMDTELERLRERESIAADAPLTNEHLHALTAVLMEAIRVMSGQEYVDEYAADYKKRLAAHGDGARGD